MHESRLKRYVIYAVFGGYVLYRGRWVIAAFVGSLAVAWWAQRYPEQFYEIALATLAVVAVVSGVAIVGGAFLVVFGALSLRYGADLTDALPEDLDEDSLY